MTHVKSICFCNSKELEDKTNAVMSEAAAQNWRYRDMKVVSTGRVCSNSGERECRAVMIFDDGQKK